MLLLDGSCHCGAARFSVRSHTPQPYMHCYCTICRKTAGGGGFSINIMGQAETMLVAGGGLGVYLAHGSEGMQCVPDGPNEAHFPTYADESIADWHHRHGLYLE